MTSMANKENAKRNMNSIAKQKQRKRTDDARSRSTSRIYMVDLSFLLSAPGTDTAYGRRVCRFDLGKGG